MKNIYLIMPAFNEASTIKQLLTDIKNTEIFNRIIVVDDGSTDNTADVAFSADVTTLKHSINRGAGAATMTGIQYAISQNPDIIATMDSDGQHSPFDLKNIITPLLEENIDIVIGSRQIDRNKMPIIRRLFNNIGNFITYLFSGIFLKDSQSGFKAFTLETAEKLKIESDGYEFCSEFIREIGRNKLSYKEVPIKTIYTNYSLSKGQSFSKGLSMLFRMFFGS